MHARRLATYLNDRRAILTAGAELARRSHSSNEGTPYEPLLARAVSDLDEDRRLLDGLMAAHDVKPDHLKSRMAWVGEKLGRLKPNDALTGYSPLSRVVELDALTAIVTTMRSSWTALAAVLPGDQPDLEAATKRAQRTLDELETLRPDALREAVS